MPGKASIRRFVSARRATPTTDTTGERFKVGPWDESTLNNGRKLAPVRKRPEGERHQGGKRLTCRTGPRGASKLGSVFNRPQAGSSSHLRGLSSAWRNRVQSSQCVKRTKVPYFTDFHWLLRVKLSMKKTGSSIHCCECLDPLGSDCGIPRNPGAWCNAVLPRRGVKTVPQPVRRPTHCGG